MAETLVQQIAKEHKIPLATVQLWWSKSKRHAVKVRFKEGSPRFRNFMKNEMKRLVKKYVKEHQKKSESRADQVREAIRCLQQW